jgi:hypothetical protein
VKLGKALSDRTMRALCQSHCTCGRAYMNLYPTVYISWPISIKFGIIDLHIMCRCTVVSLSCFIVKAKSTFHPSHVCSPIS